MSEQAVFLEDWISEIDPGSICSLDYVSLDHPTRPLINKSARMLFIRQGKAKVLLDGVEYQIRPNMLVSIAPWSVFSFPDVEETIQMEKIAYDIQYINYTLKYMPLSDCEGSELIQTVFTTPVIYLDEDQTKIVEDITGLLRRELGLESAPLPRPGNPIGSFVVTLKVMELMACYYRFLIYFRGEYVPNRIRNSPDSILSYIYAHSSEKLTLAKVAEVFFLSESGLGKRIAETTGTTFVKLLTSIRIDKVSDYLIYTQLTLDEIAKLVGFVDASHLSKHFVDRVGITPNRYRAIYGKAHSWVTRSERETAYKLTDYVYKNYMKEGLTAAIVSSEFGVSVQDLNRLLLYYAERNFDGLLNYVRINKACELLQSTDSFITDIAYDVGYNNVKTFNLNFYKFKNMTPTQFREFFTSPGRSMAKEAKEKSRKRGKKTV